MAVDEDQAYQDTAPETGLRRQLGNRHIQLIAIGGAIGTGLFMGSGKTISLAGPSVILIYMIIGFFLFFVMRAMGELLLSNSGYKTFGDFAGDLLGPWAGFFTGWTYWFCWVVTGVADVVAIAGYVAFWFPKLPLWIPALVCIAALLLLNLPTVRAFGETEFWFALIKVLAIGALIVIGIVMVVTAHHGIDGHPASLTNLWNDHGVFPTGPAGFVAGFQIAVFAFNGIELVGTTAAETKNPERTLPRAVNSIPIRVLLFYVGALVVICAVMPWRHVSPNNSPFVAMFSLAGLGTAASVVNFVVLTSATSSANSGIYSTSRMVYALAKTGDAPPSFGTLSSRGVPANALRLSCSILLIAVVLLYAGESIIEAFTIVTTISALCCLSVWTIIMVSYLAFRRRRPHLHAASTFPMPGGVPMVWAVLAFFVFVIWTLTQKTDTLIALSVTPLWFAVLGIAYLVIRRQPHHAVLRELHRQKVLAEKTGMELPEATTG